jgi:hypothetical protein
MQNARLDPDVICIFKGFEHGLGVFEHGVRLSDVAKRASGSLARERAIRDKKPAKPVNF